MKSKLANDDPIMKLGYGITAYRNIMWAMIVLFGVLTLLSVPAIVIYKGGEGYHLSLAKTVGRAKFSLGNLGYSSVQCTQIPLGIGKLSMSCPYGVIGEILDYGVNDVANGGNIKTCITDSENSVCKPNNAKSIALMQEKSLGQVAVTFDVSSSDLYTSSNSCTNE